MTDLRGRGLVIGVSDRESRAIARSLERCGFSPDVTTDILRASTYVGWHIYDILVADLSAGSEQLQRLRQQLSTPSCPPAILLTARGPGPSAQRLPDSTIAHVEQLQRPFTPQQLEDAVRRAGRHGRRLTTDIDPLVSYITLNCRRIRGRSCVAEGMGISVGTVSRQVKDLTGLTFAALLKSMKVAEAKRLLLVSSMQIQEVADDVGLGSPQNFCRVFRNATGLSPSEFRKREHRGVRTIG